MQEAAMATKDFIVFDSDSHVVEPPALWEKYLDPEYRTLGKHALWRQEGRAAAYLKVNGAMFRDKGNPNRHTPRSQQYDRWRRLQATPAPIPCQ
jgi:hypothetical protein